MSRLFSFRHQLNRKLFEKSRKESAKWKRELSMAQERQVRELHELEHTQFVEAHHSIREAITAAHNKRVAKRRAKAEAEASLKQIHSSLEPQGTDQEEKILSRPLPTHTKKKLIATLVGLASVAASGKFLYDVYNPLPPPPPPSTSSELDSLTEYFQFNLQKFSDVLTLLPQFLFSTCSPTPATSVIPILYPFCSLFSAPAE